MASARKILFIHNDQLLARTLSEPLRNQGYDLTLADAAESLALAPTADLILVDSSAAPADLCSALRDAGIMAPLLLLTGPAAFQVAEADASLVKPVRLAQLVGRMESLLNRSVSMGGTVCFAGLTLYPLVRRIEDAKGRKIALTEKETAILLHLHQAMPRAVGRDELLGKVWGYAAEVSTHTVETHIYRLRRKLGEDIVVTGEDGYHLGL